MRHPFPAAPSPQAGLAVIISNGRAGQGCPPQWPRDVEAKCRSHGLNAKVVVVQSGEDIVRAAADAVQQGASIVVAAGGDGTVSAVASQLAETGIAMGVLPMGTLNHFAKDLRIPLALDDAIEVLAKGRPLAVDVGEVNGRIFINNSGLGLYPDIVRDREAQQRRLGRGKWLALLNASLHAARRYPLLSLNMEIDGKQLNRRSAFVFIGNNEYTMTGFEIGERAGLADGKLSLYVTQRMGRFGLVRLALRALFGRLEQARDFDMLLATSVVVDTHKKLMRVSTDGEVTKMETPLRYRSRPGALRVMVPAAEARAETPPATQR
ncbi:MAG: diacylglycerol kinase family lipid kinase [Ramlibacter sp.]|nr:diacylglycerol kinase family lipid kinase [Ramlibacter sp.]